jgi:4-hydroxybenzoate polyprenyltransferase
VPSLRESVESASYPLVKRLSEWPKWAPFLLILALMVGGVLIPTVGWVLIALVGVFLTWLLYLGWPRMSPLDRFMRVAVIGLVIVAAVTRANPRTGGV